VSASPASGLDFAGAVYLREVRRFLARTHTVPVAAFFAVLYALGSMLWGGMLTLAPIPGGWSGEILLGNGGGVGWWNYPGLLIVGPWGVLALPFLPTIAMVVVAVGVGLGMAVAVALIVRLVRPSPQDIARSKAVGTITGLTPAMISLVTLGSCCTTAAAATGGIGLMAQASGSTTTNLIVNNWYLGVAQVAIVWLALFGQELLLTVYGGLLGLRSPGSPAVRVAAPPLDRGWAAGAILRGGLVVGGLLWSLSMLAEWTTQNPLASGPGWWFQWLVQHQLVATVAVAAGFFPAATLRFARAIRTGSARPVGMLALLAAATVLVWLPPPLPAWGLDSFGSQLAGLLGAPAAWGAIAPGPVTGIALAFRWALEYLVPAGFVLAAVAVPDRAFAPLLRTVATPLPPAPEEDERITEFERHVRSLAERAAAGIGGEGP
jgi:hypothetical protein